MQHFFIDDFESSRAHFIESFDRIKERFPSAELIRHYIGNPEDDLTIDIIATEKQNKPNGVIFQSGQHGIEGYVGSAILRLFIDEYIPRLNPDDTNIWLIHSINPYGMKFFRRNNRNNIDLNRNYVTNWDELHLIDNPEYRKSQNLFETNRAIGPLWWETVRFWFHFIGTYLRLGPDGLKASAARGQFFSPTGIYYGSTGYESSTRIVIDLYHRALALSDSLICLDIHSGYGDRDVMNLVNSTYEKRLPDELKCRFNYPYVIYATNEDFYTIHGDIIDYLYLTRDQSFPQKELYSTCVEFGTQGEQTLDNIRALKLFIWENRLHHHGARNPRIAEEVLRRYREYFYPADPEWRANAVRLARQAFDGVLKSD